MYIYIYIVHLQMYQYYRYNCFSENGNSVKNWNFGGSQILIGSILVETRISSHLQ